MEVELPLPDGFRDIDDVVADVERRPGGVARMERARRRLAQRLRIEQPTLASMRLERGWSQSRLAAIVGTTQAQVARYESGKQSPNAENLVNLAVALGVSADALLAALNIKPTLRDPI